MYRSQVGCNVSAIATAGSDEQTRLVRALTDPRLHGPSCTGVQVIETHISYVLLAGQCAYKIKKAVNLGFLDFTTLAARHFYCEQELELNRRLAPSIYLQVVAITGTPDAPQLDGEEPAIEYAVKMREFPQAGLLTRVLDRGELTAKHIDALASTVAAFHLASAKASSDSRFGSPAGIRDLAVENFDEIEPLLETAADRRVVAALRQWTEREHAVRAAAFADRRRRGFVRECHGDLHLGNIALVDGRVTIFDCIEFNEDMRWSDVMADVAFLVMDLEDRGRSDFAFRFLNLYLELTGDYDGVQVLRFYVVYRAMVRAKVACMRVRQTQDRDAHEAKASEYREYLRLATRCSEATATGVVITHGPSGSGKTTRSQALVELGGAIRVRTDVERKRRHGLTPLDVSGSALGAGLYSRAETEQTYAHLARLTRTIAEAGYPVVVDGTFLLRRQRDWFRALAADLGVPFVILDFVAAVDSMRARIQQRLQTRRDASEADIEVLEHQLRTAEALAPDERRLTVTIDGDAPLESSRRIDAWRPVMERLHLEHVDRARA
jgi:uncharacterized protein